MTYRVRAVLALISAALLAGCAAAPDLPKRHAIAAANPHAAEAGREMLRAGGNAVDAAVAAQLVLTLVEPQSSGIGGGAFLMYFHPGNVERDIPPEIRAYEGRETAPGAARPDMFLGPDGKPLPRRRLRAGGLTVGVPGVIRMLELAHLQHGKLPWARLFEPAIRLAENGFAVSPRLHRLIASHPVLQETPATRAYFYTLAGMPLPVGHVLRNPALADTLRRVAKDGANAFYEGEIARDIVATVRRATRLTSRMTEADIAGYTARQRRVLCGPYRQWIVCGFGPPTSGGIAVLQILAMLERFDLARLGPDSTLAMHLIAEASRLAFADRNKYVADSDFFPVPVDGLLESDYLDERGRAISALRSMGPAQPGSPPRQVALDVAPDIEPKPVGTSHLSVIDGDGNAVAMTTSVALPFGAKLMTRGFILNSQLTDFAIVPTRDGRPVVNHAWPGKRPRSSQSPTLVLDRDGRLVMAVGSPGGTNIIGYVVKALIGVLDWNLTMQQAVALPNITNRNGPTDLERGTGIAGHADALRALGHEVRLRSLTSGLHGLRVTPNGIEGGADPRREGVVLGD